MTDIDIVNDIIKYIKKCKVELWDKGPYHDIDEENKIRFEEMCLIHNYIHDLYNKD